MQPFYAIIPDQQEGRFYDFDEAMRSAAAESRRQGKPLLVMEALCLVDSSSLPVDASEDQESIKNPIATSPYGHGENTSKSAEIRSPDQNAVKSHANDGWISHNQWEAMPCRGQEIVEVHYFGHQYPEEAGYADYFDWGRVTRWRYAKPQPQDLPPHVAERIRELEEKLEAATHRGSEWKSLAESREKARKVAAAELAAFKAEAAQLIGRM